MSNISRSIIVAGFVASAAVAGCADNVTTAVRPCPCADGNVCCSSGVCAADQSACGAATAALSAQSSGDWVGYIENLTVPFMSGSDAIKVSLRVQSDGQLAGSVVLGSGTPPAPATDPNVGWPAGHSFFSQQLLFLVEGHAYDLESPKWEALRLRGIFSTTEPWGPWCHLQTSIMSAGNPGHYGCVPNFGSTSTDEGTCYLSSDPPQPINCDKLTLCRELWTCDCSADGCTNAPSNDNSIDIALDGNHGDGTISLAFSGPHNVRLQRQ
ncbi:MAG TPA: hypothetical protein VHU40_20660 [Polyangia bacterium]|jgi:hypothetical protein|nr:hypothetical protein [Polyangia bacterium]